MPLREWNPQADTRALETPDGTVYYVQAEDHPGRAQLRERWDSALPWPTMRALYFYRDGRLVGTASATEYGSFPLARIPAAELLRALPSCIASSAGDDHQL